MYSTELKIKRMTLQAEARINKYEAEKAKMAARVARWEQKAALAEKKMATWSSLTHHRKMIVRPEARASHIAHGFLRGLPYVAVEERFEVDQVVMNNAYGNVKAFWEKVINIVAGFSQTPKHEAEIKVLAWRDEHPQYKDRNGLLPRPPAPLSKEEKEARAARMVAAREKRKADHGRVAKLAAAMSRRVKT